MACSDIATGNIKYHIPDLIFNYLEEYRPQYENAISFEELSDTVNDMFQNKFPWFHLEFSLYPDQSSDLSESRVFIEVNSRAFSQKSRCFLCNKVATIDDLAHNRIKLCNVCQLTSYCRIHRHRLGNLKRHKKACSALKQTKMGPAPLIAKRTIPFSYHMIAAHVFEKWEARKQKILRQSVNEINESYMDTKKICNGTADFISYATNKNLGLNNGTNNGLITILNAFQSALQNMRTWYKDFKVLLKERDENQDPSWGKLVARYSQLLQQKLELQRNLVAAHNSLLHKFNEIDLPSRDSGLDFENLHRILCAEVIEQFKKLEGDPLEEEKKDVE